MNVFDTTNCALGEGPLWHPGRQSLFWFDILSKRVLMKDGNQLRDWQFETCVSAAGWISADQILIASEIELFTLEITTGKTDTVVALEAEKPETRSNDGRADPFGGFWIGTMGKPAQTGAGAIYRYFKGELRKLISNITISNAISFHPMAMRLILPIPASKLSTVGVCLGKTGGRSGILSLSLICERIIFIRTGRLSINLDVCGMPNGAVGALRAIAPRGLTWIIFNVQLRKALALLLVVKP